MMATQRRIGPHGLLLLASAALLLSCARQPAKVTEAPLQFIEHMPMNAEQRCLGIAVVTESLLSGELVPSAEAETADALAQRIYEAFATDKPLHYPRHVMVAGEQFPIDSREALAAVSIAVADQYKQDYEDALLTEEGQERLVAANSEHIKTVAELHKILAADSDRLVVFLAEGTRWFKDGRAAPTSHVVLIGMAEDGSLFVYDPNDPGQRIACTVEEHQQSLTIEWQCVYRDTGEMTRQRYLLIAKDRYRAVFYGDGESRETPTGSSRFP